MAMPKEFVTLFLVSTLIAGLLGYTVLSGVVIIVVLTLIILGPIAWALVFNFYPHFGYMGVFIIYLAVATGTMVGLVLGYLGRIW
jgi:hypothetical protein